jgi:SAM-dependent methyltransferase
VAVEAGEKMAAAARRRLAGLDVEVREGRFEDAPLPSPVDLVYAATAWHWIDPARGYARAAEVLRPRGALALFWNEHVRGADGELEPGEGPSARANGFFDATQELYERAGMGRYRLKPADEIRDRTPDIVASGCFGEVVRKHYPWHAEYSAADYATLLSTYSDHIRLADDVRSALLDGIAALIDERFGGRIVKHYVADLYVARAITAA